MIPTYINCKYSHTNCNVAKINRRDCADYKNCRTYKFYKQYPEPLGIGAVVHLPNGLEKEVEDE